MKLLSSWYSKTSLMISQHWFWLIAWCRQVTNYYLHQCWLNSLAQFGIADHNELKYMLGERHFYHLKSNTLLTFNNDLPTPLTIALVSRWGHFSRRRLYLGISILETRLRWNDLVSIFYLQSRFLCCWNSTFILKRPDLSTDVIYWGPSYAV